MGASRWVLVGDVIVLGVIWYFCVMYFWTGVDLTNTLIYSTLVFWGIFPFALLIFGVVWGFVTRRRIFVALGLVLAGGSMLALDVATFGYAYALQHNGWAHPPYSLFFVGLLASGVGMGVGMRLSRLFRKQRLKK